MFGHPYVWVTPLCLDTPMCLDTPRYIWMLFGCLLDIYNTKKACFVRLRGCSYAPFTFGCPHMFGCPLYVWTLLYIWALTICLDVPHTFGCPNTFGGIQTYRGAAKHGKHSNIQGVSKHVGASNHTEGCPNRGGILTYGGAQTLGGVQTYRWASKHIRGVHTWGHPIIQVSKHMGASKHTGGHQTSRGIQA